jgi:hypothetical protein
MNDVQILNRIVLTFMDKNPLFYPAMRWALIRFFSPGSPYKLELPNNCVASMEVTCDDISNTRIGQADKYTFFSEENAKKILKFVEKHQDDFDILICACEAGISRSAACGAAIEEIYLGTNSIQSSTKYCPNSLIYNTIKQCYKEQV